MSKSVVLFYEPAPTPWGERLKQYCALRGLRLRPVEAYESGRLVGDLASGSGGQAGGADPVPEPVLVLCRLGGAQTDRLLAALRDMGAGGCLKAVLTPVNAGWSFRKLYDELCRERAQWKGPDPGK